MRAPPAYVPGHGLLTGKSVLIPAAAGAGIGFSTAQKCVEEGCRAIMVSDMHPRRLDEAVAKLGEMAGGRPVFGQLCDVTKEDQVQTLINTAEEKLGGTDVLINNAGLGGSKLIVEMTDDEWNKVIDITLNGTFRMTRAMLKAMQPRGKGGGRSWRSYQCRVAEHRAARLPQEIGFRRFAQAIDQPRSLRPCCRSLGNRQRHHVPGQRLLVLHDRRNCLGQ